MPQPLRFLLPLLLLAAVPAQGWLGVYLDADSERPRIVEYVRESPAERAGLRVGDLFAAVDEQPVADRDAFVAAIRACKSGQRVRLKVERDGKELLVVVRLGERPAEISMPATAEVREKPSAPPAPAGVPATEPAPASVPPPRAYLGVGLEDGDGLVVARVIADGPAAAAGILAGDRLVKWGEVALRSSAQLEQLLGDGKPGDSVPIQVGRKDGTVSVVVVLGARATEAAPPAKAAPGKGRASAKPTPKPSTAPPEPAHAAPDDAAAVAFATDYAAASQAAAAAGKRLFVVYGASWDGSSQAQRRALRDASLAAPLGAYVCVYVDAEANSELLQERDVRELPTLEVIADGKTLWRHQGFVPAASVLDLLRGKGGPAAGLPGAPAHDAPAPARSAPARSAPAGPDSDPDARLRAEVEQLRREVVELKKLLDELRKSGGGRE